MNGFRNFMYGRYGMDRFNQILLGATLGLTLIGSLINSNILVGLSYIPLIYGLYRGLSKDIYKRTEENRKVLELVQKVKWGLQGKGRGSNQNHITRDKTVRYYKCPSCKQTIRVPKGKGKICITCPKCRTEFIKRT